MDSIQKHSTTDVLIAGAGPTGLMLALWLAELGVTTRIIDKLGTRALNGRADGYQVRTKEVWASFGLSDMLDKHANTTDEIAVWAAPQDRLLRLSRDLVFGRDTSRMTPNLLHQGHTEAILIAAIKDRNGPHVERGAMPISLKINKSSPHLRNEYPITIGVYHQQENELESWGVNSFTKLDDGSYRISRGSIDTDTVKEDFRDIVPHVDGPQGSTEIVHAKYVLGADGGHSWLRKQLGIKFEGVSIAEEWGVLDIWLKTDFPDVRKLCQITSRYGSALIIPHEKGLVRLYVQLVPGDICRSPDNPNEPAIVSQMIKKLNKIFDPYRFDFEYCDWWTIYKVGRRIAEHYSDPSKRVVLAGDAIHTHSPKAGQGMNASSQDAFNLGWKLAGAIHGQLDPKVLRTYESERRPIAEGLMEIDAMVTKVFGSHEMASERHIQDLHVMQRTFGSGTSATYGPNLTISTSPSAAGLASNVVMGRRFPSKIVYNHSDGVAIDALSLLKADGIWRLLVLGGDITDKKQLDRVNKLGERLEREVLGKFVSAKPNRAFIQPILIHASKVSDIESNDFQHCYFPFDKTRGHDYNLIYADVSAVSKYNDGEVLHKALGITSQGCMIVTRPDQIVGFIGGLDDVDALIEYFDRFMKRKA